MINRQRNSPRRASTPLLFSASKKLRESYGFVLKGRGFKLRRKTSEPIAALGVAENTQTHAAPWKSGASAPRKASEINRGFSPRFPACTGNAFFRNLSGAAAAGLSN
jgi:hypothetical protein